jgi:DNA repair exonuclease SbcCD ATPase subunit
MRLLSIRLTNVRRFTGPVVVSGLGPGLNLLTAPNESGKSTVFEALNAVFFKRANSMDKDVRALIPHAGGDPEVEVSFEAEGTRFRLRKTWSGSASRRDVRLWENDRLVAQADAAEARIATLLQPPKEGGPAGLLWVRQGLTALEADASGRETRRGLLASVMGEVEAMTGGRRMEAAVEAVTADLARYVTATGKSRAGGALADAEAQVAELERQAADLTGKVSALRGALDQRRVLRADLSALQDPAAQADLRDRLTKAEAAYALAERHAERLTAAKGAEAAAKDGVAAATSALAKLHAARQERDAADAAMQETASAATRAGTAATEARRSLDATLRAMQAARQASEDADPVLAQLNRADTARAGAALRQELLAVLARGERLTSDIAGAEAAAALGPDSATMERLETLCDTLRVERRAAEAAAPHLTAFYGPGAEEPIRWEGGTLAEGAAVPVPNGAVLTLPGLGRLEVTAGAGGAGDSIDAAQRAVQAALQSIGCTGIAEARAAAQQRRAARDRLVEMRQRRAQDFPDGLDALRIRIAGLPVAADDADRTLPDRATAEADAAAARQALALAQGHLDAARAEADRANGADNAASARRDAASDRAARAATALAADTGPDRTPEAAQTAAETRLADAVTRLASTEAARRGLETDAPDLDQARLRLTRLRAARAEAERKHLDLQKDLGELDGTIKVTAGAAPEQEAADCAARLATARKRLSALQVEVQVLTRLKDALESARDDARDRFVAPVMAELRPLLAMLLPGSELALDADSLLPETLIRDGQPERETVLSGGTREQIALLVRLAFARLLARSGHPAPVILDDAIVFTDDDRIERLFDALTRQAEELQIIVFSCRQRAFRDLGARQLRLVPATDDSDAQGG